ncbi:AMP-binding protein [Frankia sp. Cj5]|uniref:AMP-binding protein n=1 Tax=Frankia sp. Cj5 TaxID=2880978 RepID=UPI001EF5AC54|nr:AMP-binding protein [Frankia sp. Cj5]
MPAVLGNPRSMDLEKRSSAGRHRMIDLVEARSRDHPHRVFLTDAGSGHSLRYGELNTTIRDWWSELDRAGCRPGQRVAIAVSDPVDFATAYLAAITSGRHAVPLSPSAPPAELRRILALARPAAVVTDQGLPPAAGVQQIAPCPARTGYHGVAPGGDGGVLLSTSGTTGTAKQIFLAEAQLSHVAHAVAGHHALTRADIGFCPLPLFHVNAEVVGLLATLVAGGAMVLDTRFHRRGFWRRIVEHNVTWINAVPAMVTILARDPDAGQARSTRVRFVRSASAALPVAVLHAFEQATGIEVLETYGMTEAASQITANPLRGVRKAGSVGLPVATEVRVVDEDGQECPAGVTGHVQIRGAGVIRAYVGEAGNERIDVHGWLDTGDLGYLDTDRYLFLVGRTDDVINRGGEKIFPREVEEVLLTDPRVSAAVVVGRPDPVLGQTPVALVVPATGAGEGLAADLAARCESALDRFKRPVTIDLVDALPVGPTGKVMRRLAGSRLDGSRRLRDRLGCTNGLS